MEVALIRLVTIHFTMFRFLREIIVVSQLPADQHHLMRFS